MRLIPGKTKVQIELFKGVTLTDILIGLLAVLMVVFLLTSSIPGKLYLIGAVVVLAAILVVRLDDEPNYTFLLHILRHFVYVRSYRRSVSDRKLTGSTEHTDETAASARRETPEERKRRLKAEAAERKADDKRLADRNVSKAEKDAIWLKRAKQSAAKKQEKEASYGKNDAHDMGEIAAFRGIADDFIEYGEYFGAVIEVFPVEFRLFTAYRRNYSIENSFGKLLRMLPSEYAANIVKLERPVIYDEYLKNEYKKIDEVRRSYEQGFISEKELKIRVEVLCDRINDLRALNTESPVIEPCYYLVFFDSDKTQLNNLTENAAASLRAGDIECRRLNTKELAVFLKYTNSIDFDERDIEKLDPKDYAAWAMPETLQIKHRTAVVNGMVTHNMRVVRYPAQVDDAWLASVMSLPATKVVVKCRPMDHDKAVRNIDNSLTELRGQFMATGIESKRIELQEHIDTLSSLLATLQSANETLLNTNIYVTGYDIVNTRISRGDKGDSLKSVRAAVNNMRRVIYRTYQENNLRINNMEFDQVNAFIASQISAWDPMNRTGRGIPSNSVAASYPWIFSHVADKNGIKIGSTDGTPVFVDFFRRDSERVNSNMVIVGKSGSGKSYATKSLLTNLAADDAKIFILDPENEYTELANNLHGKFINVGNAQFGRLNPFHIITALDDDEAGGNTSGSYATHLQFLEEFFRQILPDCDKDAMEYLNSAIDRMYINRGITPETDLSALRPEDYPVFDDLYDTVLSEFQSTDNDYIRTMLRTLMNYIAKFASGGRNANIWNGPSTVTTEENFTVFNFQSLLANRNGAIANAQMLLVLKYIDNEIIKNRDYNTKYGLKRKIVVVIDEAHVFIDTKYPIALDFMFQLAKRIRKYNGMQIVITQNIKDFVGSEEIARKSTAIINACQYSFIFSLAPNDIADLCKLYEKAGGINEFEQEEIVSAPRGQAFAVMSPKSRTTFKIEVPGDIAEMFEKPDYGTHYFGGEDGEAKWNEFLGESRINHAEALDRARKESLVSVIRQEQKKKRVTFVEMTEEQLAEERRNRARRVPKLTDDAPEPEKTVTLKAEPSGRTVTLAEETAEQIAAEFAAAEKAEQTAELHAPAEESRAFSFLDIDTPAAPKADRGDDRGIMFIEEPGKPAAAAPVSAPEASGRTEELLTALLAQFSHDTMIEEIRRSVREELEKEYVRRPQNTGGTDDAADSGTASVSASVGEEAAQKAEDTAAAPAPAAEEEPAANTFDIMEMLMQEAENMDDVSPLDMMEEYGEEILEIRLEELMKYNVKHP